MCFELKQELMWPSSNVNTKIFEMFILPFLDIKAFRVKKYKIEDENKIYLVRFNTSNNKWICRKNVFK